MDHNYLRPCSPEKKFRQKVALVLAALGTKMLQGLTALGTKMCLGLTALGTKMCLGLRALITKICQPRVHFGTLG